MLKHIVLLLTLFSLVSCDSAVEPPASSKDYFPLTVGSSWDYTGSITPTSPSDQRYSFVCIDTLYFDKKVKLLIDRSTYYGYRYYKSGDTTFMLWGGGFRMPGPDDYTPLLLPKIDETWTVEYIGDFGNTLKITSTVQSTNDTLTVSGKKYSDVMKVRLESINSWIGTDTVEGSHYFSKGVGLIKTVNSPFFNNIEITDYLVR